MTDKPHHPPDFDELMADAKLTYNAPPAARDMPLGEMWRDIEREAWSAQVLSPRQLSTVRRRTLPAWLGIAAALLAGIGIGRMSSSLGGTPPFGSALSTRGEDVVQPESTGRRQSVPLGRTPATAGAAQPVDAATSRYLGQAAALLIALPTETNAPRPDETFIRRADDLLLTTRLLLDSPAASEQGLRPLLEDLELVLVQVVQLERGRAPTRRTELELIQQALDQRDVLPRLRSAVSEHASDN
jgi:hypothetical protein